MNKYHIESVYLSSAEAEKVMLPPTYKLKQPFLYGMQNPLFKTAGPLTCIYTFLFWISGVKVQKGKTCVAVNDICRTSYFSFQHSC